jgi:hypothetical protein
MYVIPKTSVYYGKFPLMKMLTVDSSKRIRIPDAKPSQVYAYQTEGKRITLTLVEPVPPPQARIVKVRGRKYLASDRPVTKEDTQEVMANFP